MISLDYILLGYFNVEAESGTEGRILSRLQEAGISARFSGKEGLTVKQKHRKTAERVLYGLKISFSENKGLPQILYRNRKRYGLFFAFFACVLCFLFSGSRIWDIRVKGAEGEMQAEVIERLEKEGVFVGAPFRGLDLSRAESGLLDACPEVGWVNLNRRGTVMYAEVILRAQQRPQAEAKISNIVAAEDAVVTAVSPTSGVARVKVGQAVRKGTLLISAVHPDGTVSGAEGEVLGRVSGLVSAKVALDESITVVEKERTVSVRLKILNFSINIFKNYGNPREDCDIIENESRLRLFGRYALPVSVCTKTAYIERKKPVRYSRSEAAALAGTRLRTELSALFARGELVSLKTEGEWTDEGFVMRAYYEQIRSIGQAQIIGTEEKG